MTNRSRPNTTPLEDIPKKIYYSISEASEFTGVEPHVLRYWETKFSKLNPKRVGGNQRKYTRNDIELLYEIVNLLYFEGYTLDGAERKLKGGLQALRAERESEKEREQEQDLKPDNEKNIPMVNEEETAVSSVEKEYDLFEFSEIDEDVDENIPLHSHLAEIKRDLQEILTLLEG